MIKLSNSFWNFSSIPRFYMLFLLFITASFIMIYRENHQVWRLIRYTSFWFKSSLCKYWKSWMTGTDQTNLGSIVQSTTHTDLDRRIWPSMTTISMLFQKVYSFFVLVQNSIFIRPKTVAVVTHPEPNYLSYLRDFVSFVMLAEFHPGIPRHFVVRSKKFTNCWPFNFDGLRSEPFASASWKSFWCPKKC